MRGAVVLHTGRRVALGAPSTTGWGVEQCPERDTPRKAGQGSTRAEEPASPPPGSLHSCWPMLPLPTSEDQPVPWMR